MEEVVPFGTLGALRCASGAGFVPRWALGGRAARRADSGSTDSDAGSFRVMGVRLSGPLSTASRAGLRLPPPFTTPSVGPSAM